MPSPSLPYLSQQNQKQNIPQQQQQQQQTHLPPPFSSHGSLSFPFGSMAENTSKETNEKKTRREKSEMFHRLMNQINSVSAQVVMAASASHASTSTASASIAAAMAHPQLLLQPPMIPYPTRLDIPPFLHPLSSHLSLYPSFVSPISQSKSSTKSTVFSTSSDKSISFPSPSPSASASFISASSSTPRSDLEQCAALPLFLPSPTQSLSLTLPISLLPPFMVPFMPSSFSIPQSASSLSSSLLLVVIPTHSALSSSSSSSSLSSSILLTNLTLAFNYISSKLKSPSNTSA
ncbi:uncharacterized protein MONOS_13904 [Monocercomonoides exilis]|uniref:uncharacterized protein n=1 Tax=Monocercomonoides exilis TaxID=2049356 RepID=UPI00355AB244|nr:hypothetical protein MONOS_13904 [Monocercomonoides exilis]|eukprot:MONOS_13904.1-p1 / transcript=MONOS_13904.1 / gene=MONOS_13904 / organism=Monocercomonoides_exilis_PA203 / gene_product=unspecified product / transcript_product=unspecified product / location=Mono_scaffold00901:20891-21760(-) / protein_length=290 / sequence_SO=supercontig / SO=protein_coding / is_pseudo=false